MLVYIFKSALVLTLLYGIFALLLSKESFHRFNRMMLVNILIFSFIIPAIHITTSHPIMGVQEMSDVISYNDKSVIGMSEHLKTSQKETQEVKVSTEQPISTNIMDRISWSKLAFWIYIPGVVIMLFVTLSQIIRLLLSLKGGLRHNDVHGNTIILHREPISSFSIFHYIVMSIEDYEQNKHFILTHELEHIRLGHSYDLVLLEIVKLIQWFNPFVWLLARDLRNIHEYEADEAVIKQGIDAKSYQQLLVIKAVGNRLQPFVNSLNHGLLKKRIKMMYQKKSNRWQMLKALCIVPVVALTITAFATPVEKELLPQKMGMPDKRSSSTVSELPMIEYVKDFKISNNISNLFIINLPKNVWIERSIAGSSSEKGVEKDHATENTVDKSYLEEQFFRYAFQEDPKITLKLDGVPFDKDRLPNLPNTVLKKLEINRSGEYVIVNLVTKPVKIPSNVKGNIPSVLTILLPGKANIYFTEGKAEQGNWMRSTVTSWDVDRFGNQGIRRYLKLSMNKPDFKVYVYAHKQTSQDDINHILSIFKELHIHNYEILKNIGGEVIPHKTVVNEKSKMNISSKKELRFSNPIILYNPILASVLMMTY